MPADQTTISASAIRARTSSTSAATAADAATLSFDAVRNEKNAPSSPGAIGAPLPDHRRNGSPSASSTFTTSAPPSASSFVQYAPANPVERSTTRVPTSGQRSLIEAGAPCLRHVNGLVHPGHAGLASPRAVR